MGVRGGRVLLRGRLLGSARLLGSGRPAPWQGQRGHERDHGERERFSSFTQADSGIPN